MAEITHIDATWTPTARADLERFIVNSRVPGAVLSLFKSGDDAAGSRWSFAVLNPERIQALSAALAARKHPLLYDLDGLRVAISNPRHASELQGMVVDIDGRGYLTVRPRTIS
jgi:hypothetical protein